MNVIRALMVALQNDEADLSRLELEGARLIEACGGEALLPTKLHDGSRFTAKKAKLAFLREVDAALRGRVKATETGGGGRLDYAAIERATKKRAMNDERAQRVHAVSVDVLGSILDDEKYAALFDRPLTPNAVPEYLRRMEAALRWCFANGNAETAHVARAVLWAFGVPPAKLKNMFSEQLLQGWKRLKGVTVERRTDQR